MIFRYFSFEGRLKEPDPDFQCLGVCSSCLIPNGSLAEAKVLFYKALEFKGMKLVKILEEFAVNDQELDSENEDHLDWIELCEFAKVSEKVVFNEMNVFDPE